jgi:hypothetical protein
MTHEEVIDLTPAQLAAEVGEGRSGENVGRDEIERRAAAARDAVFAKACGAAELTPARFAALPAPDIAARVRAVVGEGSRIDESQLAGWAKDYAVRATNAGK